MYIFCMILLSFFAAVGLWSFITAIIEGVFCSKGENEYLLILPDLTAKNAEFRLRCAISKMKKIGRGRIFCLADQADEEAIEILHFILNDYPYVELVTEDQLKEKLGQKDPARVVTV